MTVKVSLKFQSYNIEIHYSLTQNSSKCECIMTIVELCPLISIWYLPDCICERSDSSHLDAWGVAGSAAWIQTPGIHTPNPREPGIVDMKHPGTRHPSALPKKGPPRSAIFPAGRRCRQSLVLLVHPNTELSAFSCFTLSHGSFSTVIYVILKRILWDLFNLCIVTCVLNSGYLY